MAGAATTPTAATSTTPVQPPCPPSFLPPIQPLLPSWLLPARAWPPEKSSPPSSLLEKI
uniref:H0515C11.5 protein n=1 Tax=Oryza sativa TaxID=4530 RepID=Q01MI6_ORYSA|nr:H0515C11.5 [Oryza sativa]